MLLEIGLVFLGVIVIMLLGTPVAAAFCIGSIVMVALAGLDLGWVGSQAFNLVQSFVFLCFPLYVLLGSVVNISGVANRLCDWFTVLLGRVKGGLGVAAICTNGVFAAMSGSSLSALAGIGRALLPSLEARGYPKEYSIALLINSATLALQIPPSGGMIIFGFMGGLPISMCFLAGVIPGVVLMILLSIVNVVMCRNIPTIQVSPKREFKTEVKETAKATKKAFFALLIPVVCLGGIYAGLYTPTEAAAVGAVYAIFLGLFIYRTLTLKHLGHGLLETGIVTSSIIIVIFFFTVISKVLILVEVSTAILNLMLAISTNLYVQIFLLNLLLFIMGMFIDDASCTMISAVILLPVAIKLGIDPYHMAAMVSVTHAIGLITPPVAALLYLGGHIANLPVNKYLKPTAIFTLFAMIPTALVTMYVPAFSTTLPYLFSKG